MRFLAFREQSPDERLTVRMKGLDTQKHYELQNADTSETVSLTGERLMQDGFEIVIPEIGESALLWVRGL